MTKMFKSSNLVSGSTDSKDMLNRIIEIAMFLFSNHGYKKTTLSDIAAEVGMVKSALYYYFPNKKAILEKAIDSECSRYFEIIQLACRSGTAVQRFESFFYSRWKFMHEVDMLYPTLHDEYLAAYECITNARNKTRDFEVELLKTIIRAGQKSGEFISGKPSTLASAVYELLEGLVLLWLSQKDLTAGRTDIRTTQFELISRGLQK